MIFVQISDKKDTSKTGLDEDKIKADKKKICYFPAITSLARNTMMSQTEIQKTIASFTSIEQALDHFDIEYDSKFINEYGTQLVKRFNGYLILQKPEDWFAARRALKNAYCKIQRSRLDKYTRQACRGCTTCQRR